MPINSNDPQPRAVFVADSHFHVRRDAAEQRRLDLFVAFLATEARRAEHLVLMGDIFDFWFDYPHFLLKGYEAVLQSLDTVRDAGTRIHFVGGNHDIWAARYLHERYGTEPAAGPLDLALDGLRLRCVHGDGLLGKEWLYRGFRAIVRSRAGVLLGKSLHPELLFAFSTWLSGHSRTADRDEAAGIEAKAARLLARSGHADWDVLLMGHVHHPMDLERDGRRLVSLGGWLEAPNFGRLQDGQLELCRFDAAVRGV